MPKQYEAMRDKFAKGAKVDSPGYDAAQSKAAAIYNASHPGAPVTSMPHTASGMKAKAKKPKKAKKPIPPRGPIGLSTLAR